MRSLLFPIYLVTGLLLLHSNAQGTLDLDLTNLNNSDVGAGPYPKFPDILECNNIYGEGLDPQKCFEAIDDVPDGGQFLKYVSHKQYPGQSAFVVPQFYYDNESKSRGVSTSRDAAILTSTFNSAPFLRNLG